MINHILLTFLIPSFIDASKWRNRVANYETGCIGKIHLIISLFNFVQLFKTNALSVSRILNSLITQTNTLWGSY